MNPDPGHDIPSMRNNQFNPLMGNLTPVLSSLPCFPAASLSHGEVLRQIHLNSPVPQPSLSNSQVRRTASNSTGAALLSYIEPRSKRTFDSAFEGDSSHGKSVEKAMGPKPGWFPDIPKDDRRRFLLQQSSEDFEHQCRMVTILLTKLFKMFS